MLDPPPTFKSQSKNHERQASHKLAVSPDDDAYLIALNHSRSLPLTPTEPSQLRRVKNADLNIDDQSPSVSSPLVKTPMSNDETPIISAAHRHDHALKMDF